MEITNLEGRIATKVEATNSSVYFTMADGKRYALEHQQDCCENVYIEDIVGDLQDLVGTRICLAEESSNRDDPPAGEYTPESYTWTYYKFATIKGYVDIRFFGSSNGYYSEGVSFVEIK